jgi:hypothetical protein
VAAADSAAVFGRTGIGPRIAATFASTSGGDRVLVKQLARTCGRRCGDLRRD